MLNLMVMALTVHLSFGMPYTGSGVEIVYTKGGHPTFPKVTELGVYTGAVLLY